MNNYIYFGIILIGIFILYYVLQLNADHEYFLNDVMKVKRGPQILDDKLFTDVVTYDNDEDGRLGIDKCLEACNGTCLEYGISGIAHCFPRTFGYGKNYNTIMRDWENEVDEVERAGTKLVYPSIR